jgi:hypothetical protein
VERYGSPEAIVTDGGAIFRANQAHSIYEALNVDKEEIERGRPCQSYIETTFNIQRRMADWHFARAESWPELVAIDDRWVQDYNEQSHWAHREREDGRRSPQEVLGWVTGVVASPAAGPFHLHGGHLATHATGFLSSFVPEGVPDIMSRSAQFSEVAVCGA